MDLEDLIINTKNYQQIKEILDNQENSRILLTGLTGSSKALVISSIFKENKKSLLVIEDNSLHANRMLDELSNLISEDFLASFVVDEDVSTRLAVVSPEIRSAKIHALDLILSDKPVIVVVNLSGLQTLLPDPNYFSENILSLKIGTEFNLYKLKEQLIFMGYKNTKLVLKPGDFSVRGSVVDVYPLNLEYPIRLDFFDNEIDSIRTFNPEDQRSIGNISGINLLPATEYLINEDALEKGKSILKDKVSLESELNYEYFNKLLAPESNFVNNPDLLLYKQIFWKNLVNIIDYFSKEFLICFDDRNRLLSMQDELQNGFHSWIKDKKNIGELISVDKAKLLDIKEIINSKKYHQIWFSLFAKSMGRLRLNLIVNFDNQELPKFYGQISIIKDELVKWRKEKYTVVILINDSKRINDFNNTLLDFDISLSLNKKSNLKLNETQIILGSLQNGFILNDAKLVIVTENELFKTKTIHHHNLKINNAERIRSYSELYPGDYVVHVNHGIGKYEGIKTLEVDGVHKDYLSIAYQKNDKIFLPINKINLLQKYVSADNKKPHLNKLGGTEWAKTKLRVANKIEKIADDLIDLYAAREMQKGHAFMHDDQYQLDFENEFPYTETSDQLRSIEEVKADMEKEKPMDRLLVGDVGFGKTEVALRAAFKAVEDGKQVAFLVPTTILAQQHFQTIKERFEKFPVKVSMLSRFSSSKETKKIINDLNDHNIDIIVGTHRLLSKDVSFADLGLLIIDEEQRFGVKHKEKIKQLKNNVDVLTLTATPIPRTLNMSMIGVRDLSVIETPPANRYPIQTYVMEYNFNVLKQSIMREMSRGGQVFYLHNRVHDIESVVDNIKQIVPEARIAYIHGQMNETSLETVLYDFIHGEYDVLVTTTIIETGIDMPNVNTLFIEDADKMGLSQLYQLRGRIGRSNRLAYAYFTYQPNKVLTEDSEKRLKAIQDFTELGSGFKIAMRDLSIRGAGNLLGKQQHGFIDSVGYDLYSQMLSDAINKKKGIDNIDDKQNTSININVDAYIPKSYINDEQQKIEFYRRLHNLENNDQYLNVEADLLDRFGDYPNEVTNLLLVSKLQMYCSRSGIRSLDQNNNKITLIFNSNVNKYLTDSIILEKFSKLNFKIILSKTNGKKSIQIILQPKDDLMSVLRNLLKVIKALYEYLLDMNFRT